MESWRRRGFESSRFGQVAALRVPRMARHLSLLEMIALDQHIRFRDGEEQRGRSLRVHGTVVDLGKLDAVVVSGSACMDVWRRQSLRQSQK